MEHSERIAALVLGSTVIIAFVCSSFYFLARMAILPEKHSPEHAGVSIMIAFSFLVSVFFILGLTPTLEAGVTACSVFVIICAAVYLIAEKRCTC